MSYKEFYFSPLNQTNPLKHQTRTITKKQTNLGSGNTATIVLCEVKLLFLSIESGSFEESDITTVSG